MKQVKLTTLMFGLLLFGCKQADTKITSTDDKEQIQQLIRQVLNWANSKNSIELLPAVTDGKNSVYTGFDLDRHRQNLDTLRQTRFFAAEFIENYNQIILTLDKGLKNNHYATWPVGTLPTFAFANDVDPWTMCQDIPYDKPNPRDHIEISIINPDRGEVAWKWSKLELNPDAGWKNFTYRFKVLKEKGKWKIAYLAGFDFEESTCKD